jgi:hypothetical protein
MHDVKALRATPGLARRLIALSEINGLQFDQKLVDLALLDIVDGRRLEGFAHQLNGEALQALQFVRDWNGRAMILCDDSLVAQKVSLANAWLEGGRTLILTRPKTYGHWATLVREAFPDAVISVFGNPRYDEKVSYPPGITFEHKPNVEADFFISSYGAVLWHDLLDSTTINRAIVEELDTQGNVIAGGWQSAVKGLFREMPAPIFIQNIQNLPNDPGRDNLTSLQCQDSRPLDFISSTVTNYMWAGISDLQALVGGHYSKDVDVYLESRGYDKFDALKKLEILGVSSHLVGQDNSSPLVFYDASISVLIANGSRPRQQSNLYQFVERERALEHRLGQNVASVVTQALEGHRPSATLIDGLRTPQWANLKSRHIKEIDDYLGGPMARCLYLTAHQDVKRSLLLHFNHGMVDLSTSADGHLDMARFLYRDNTLTLSHQQFSQMRPLKNLIVTIDELAARPELIGVANYIFLVDPPQDREYYEGLLAAALASGTRVVISVITGTFEEEIFRQIS